MLLRSESKEDRVLFLKKSEIVKNQDLTPFLLPPQASSHKTASFLVLCHCPLENFDPLDEPSMLPSHSPIMAMIY